MVTGDWASASGGNTMKSQVISEKDGNGKGSMKENKKVIDARSKETIDASKESVVALKLIDLVYLPDDKRLAEMSSISHSERFNLSLLQLTIESNKEDFDLGKAPEIWLECYLRLGRSVGGYLSNKAHGLIEQQLSLKSEEQGDEPDIPD